MCNQSEDLQKKIEEALLNGENSAKALTVCQPVTLCSSIHLTPFWIFICFVFQELSEQYETEKTELLTEIVTLQDEISHLSSSALAKEKESMRKDLEKTKAKLKETESKLRNTIQEKTKLEVSFSLLEI